MADRETLSTHIEEGREPEVGPETFLTSGSTLLNLAGAQRKSGLWPMGRIANIVGDGSSGKTILAVETAAAALYEIEGLQVFYDNAEMVFDFDVEEMYGIQPEDILMKKPSETIEQFGVNFMRAVDSAKGRPVLYFLDSLDSLGSEEEVKRFEAAAKKGKEPDGSYNLEKQRYLNQFFRSYIVNSMKDNVCLIIVSQVRDKIGVTFGKRQYRTGGKALDFYTHQVVWLRVKEKLTRTIKGHTRVYGIRVHAKFERNKIAKPFREVEFVVLFDHGVDDLGSMVDWLYGPKDKEINWRGQKFTRQTLIDYLEENNLEGELRVDVATKWHDIEDSFRPVRKGKYFATPEEEDGD